MTLRAAQHGIAANWQTLYKKVFGVAPWGAEQERAITGRKTATARSG